MLIKILFIILIGLSAGGVTATGLFALISSIGLINRYADVTNTTESIMLYEEMIIFGAGTVSYTHLTLPTNSLV